MQTQVIQSQSQDRNIRLIGVNQVTDMTSLCRAVIWERIRDGDFPKPIPVGRQRGDGRNSKVAWLEGEVIAWVMAQVQRARGGVD